MPLSRINNPFLSSSGAGNASITSPSANTIAFTTATTERMRIDSSGNVGIGTASPSVRLDVQDTAAISRITSTTGANAVRQQVVNTGGTSQFGRESSGGGTILSGADGYSTVLTGSGAYPMIFGTNATERMRIDSSGNVGINNTNPNQYATSGKVVNITGTANLSGPANLFMSGNSSQLGSGYYATEVFAIQSLSTATEITRLTGTGNNGYRAYFKIIVTGHTGGLANGINIKEFYWDGGTNAPVQISTYTANSPHPITFDNTTSNICIIKLASGNGSGEGKAVMKVEWMIPPDFNGSTYTIS
jgi:hypothetical protein